MNPISLIILIIISILLCLNYGDWKNWISYYPTILYLIIGDLTCEILTYRNPLWSYNIKPLNHVSVDLLVILFIYPCTVILFLSYYPKLIKKQMIYILLWVFVYSVVEYISTFLGGFSYSNGWTLGWSILFNCIVFPLLYLHYKRPLWVWPISMALAFIILFIFKIPFDYSYR